MDKFDRIRQKHLAHDCFFRIPLVNAHSVKVRVFFCPHITAQAAQALQRSVLKAAHAKKMDFEEYYVNGYDGSGAKNADSKGVDKDGDDYYYEEGDEDKDNTESAYYYDDADSDGNDAYYYYDDDATVAYWV